MNDDTKVILQAIDKLGDRIDKVDDKVDDVRATVSGHTANLVEGARRMDELKRSVEKFDKHLFEGNGQESFSIRLTRVEDTVKSHNNTLKHSKAIVVTIISAFITSIASMFKGYLGLK